MTAPPLGSSGRRYRRFKIKSRSGSCPLCEAHKKGKIVDVSPPPQRLALSIPYLAEFGLSGKFEHRQPRYPRFLSQVTAAKQGKLSESD